MNRLTLISPARERKLKEKAVLEDKPELYPGLPELLKVADEILRIDLQQETFTEAQVLQYTQKSGEIRRMAEEIGKRHYDVGRGRVQENFLLARTRLQQAIRRFERSLDGPDSPEELRRRKSPLGLVT